MLELYRIDSQGNRRMAMNGDGDGRFVVVDASFAGVLTASLTNAKISDSGIYECVAHDNNATDRKNVTIHVDGRHIQNIN